MTAGVILFGPPGAGKDTVSEVLCRAYSGYQLFHRAKCGPGSTKGYRMISGEEAGRLRAAGEVIWENERYGATYFVDRTALRAALASHIPVIFLGQADAMAAVRGAFPDCIWVLVSLWCSRETSEARVRARGSSDVAERLAAWDATERIAADIEINTEVIEPSSAARQIHQHVRALGVPAQQGVGG